MVCRLLGSACKEKSTFLHDHQVVCGPISLSAWRILVSRASIGPPPRTTYAIPSMYLGYCPSHNHLCCHISFVLVVYTKWSSWYPLLLSEYARTPSRMQIAPLIGYLEWIRCFEGGEVHHCGSYLPDKDKRVLHQIWMSRCRSGESRGGTDDTASATLGGVEVHRRSRDGLFPGEDFWRAPRLWGPCFPRKRNTLWVAFPALYAMSGTPCPMCLTCHTFLPYSRFFWTR